jgi:hypothetical protein
MTFGPCKPGFRPWAPVIDAMQRECRLRGDRGSWTERSAGEAPEPGGKAERPGTAQRLDGDPQGPDPGNAGEGRPPRRRFSARAASYHDLALPEGNAVGLAGQPGPVIARKRNGARETGLVRSHGDSSRSAAGTPDGDLPGADVHAVHLAGERMAVTAGDHREVTKEPAVGTDHRDAGRVLAAAIWPAVSGLAMW